LIFIMTGGGPAQASQTLPLYMYEQAFSYGQLGYGTAVALLLLLIGAVASLLYLRLLPEEEKRWLPLPRPRAPTAPPAPNGPSDRPRRSAAPGRARGNAPPPPPAGWRWWSSAPHSWSPCSGWGWRPSTPQPRCRCRYPARGAGASTR